jgi:putative cell wall-binding protein/sugar lactone lactonase YvrE
MGEKLPTAKSKICRAGIAAVVAATTVLAGVAVAAPANASIPSARVSGSDRFATAVAASKAHFPKTASVVFLANGLNFADALSASAAAAHKGGPLLLTSPTSLPASTLAELKRLKPKSVVVVGGTGAVSNTVAAKVKALGATVTRLAGKDRFATSRAVAAAEFSSSDYAYIANGLAFPDALAASGAAGAKGAPVILVNGTAHAADAETLNTLKKLKVYTTYVAGGTGAVSAGIASSLKTAGYGVWRAGGSDRYATSEALAETVSNYVSSSAVIATGTGFADGLVAGSYAAGKSPVLLSQPNCIPSATAFALDYFDTSSLVLIGGTGALSTAVGAGHKCDGGTVTYVKPKVTAGKVTVTNYKVGLGVALKATAGTWTAGATLTWQWLRDGVAIAGATSSTYTPTIKDLGHEVYPQVTGSKTGYTSVTAKASSDTWWFQTLYAQELASDASGNVFAVDESDGSVVKINTAGKIGLIQGAAASNTETNPQLAVAPSGNLFIANTVETIDASYHITGRSTTIVKVTPAGAKTTVVTNAKLAAFVQPDGERSDDVIADASIDGAGNLYVIDSGHDSILKVTPAGAIAAVAAEDYAVADGNKTPQFTGYPEYLVADSAGNIFVNAGDKIQKINTAHAVGTFAGNGTDGKPKAGAAKSSPLGYLNGMAIDAAGNIYLADSENKVVEKITKTGTLSIFAGELGVTGSKVVAGPATKTALPSIGSIAANKSSVYVGGGYLAKITTGGTLSVLEAY